MLAAEMPSTKLASVREKKFENGFCINMQSVLSCKKENEVLHQLSVEKKKSTTTSPLKPSTLDDKFLYILREQK